MGPGILLAERSILGGALDGAVTGAVAGAILGLVVGIVLMVRKRLASKPPGGRDRPEDRP